MFAPKPGIMRGAASALNKFSNLTNLPVEGMGPWDHAKDALQHYDYIVLGGGSAGSVVASRLAEDPDVKVLILEAGYTDEIISSKMPAVFLLTVGSETDWNLKTVPQKHAAGRSMVQPRGKMLGGSSSMNAMMYHRGPASDFDEWEAFGNPGWSYEECLPYFKKSEGFNDPNHPAGHPKGPLTSRIRKSQYETFDPAYHGTEGPWEVSFHHLCDSTEAFIRANVAEGIPFNTDFNGPSTIGCNRIQTFIQRDAVRSSLSRAFLKPKVNVPGGKTRGTIRVVYGADVRRILVQTRKGRKMAFGVEFMDHKKVLRRVTAVREVLLCAGAFGSPHLLLASGIGPSPQPSINHIHTLPGVGRNLMDHLGIGVVFQARNRCRTLHQDLAYSRVFLTFLEYMVRGVGVLSSQTGEAACFLRLQDIAPEFVAREKANGTWQERASGPNSPHLELIFVPFYVREHGAIMAPDTKSYYTILALLMNPCSSGSVTIRPKKNKQKRKESQNEPPEMETIIDPNYFSDPFDVRVMAEGIKFIRKLGRRLNQDPEVGGREVFPGEENVPDNDDAGLDRYIRGSAETYYHPTTTCKMGPESDPLAVVDARLNVYGIDRLRVIDASVMPKLVAAHTCAPVAMIAERASDMIKEDWQDPVVRMKETNVARL